jgi:hypothetical protein
MPAVHTVPALVDAIVNYYATENRLT